MRPGPPYVLRTALCTYLSSRPDQRIAAPCPLASVSVAVEYIGPSNITPLVRSTLDRAVMIMLPSSASASPGCPPTVLSSQAPSLPSAFRSLLPLCRHGLFSPLIAFLARASRPPPSSPPRSSSALSCQCLALSSLFQYRFCACSPRARVASYQSTRVIRVPQISKHASLTRSDRRARRDAGRTRTCFDAPLRRARCLPQHARSDGIRPSTRYIRTIASAPTFWCSVHETGTSRLLARLRLLHWLRHSLERASERYIH
ncbi:hypothetical protein PYCCODRAFT_166192 [Trametes coccinea BRFM310]|uniref:Uncharacterized protein n=1 Tax=Trametes coccinea (strain BRFM310) TaxID=1353009 RepID=A0A1Y2IS60_TRAC3|nr:hypothetical protein PYCCODRAFT_166192 [Trametes coccinea BRFM310]